MRVISGKYKKYQIKTVKSLTTRPTTSQTKETFFNILDNYFFFENKMILDLFAGSGQLGLEALSRGASHCYFNDHNAVAIRIIESNMQKLHIENYHFFCLAYEKCLQIVAKKKLRFDLIILDPPFKKKEFYQNSFDKIKYYNILNINGIIMCEAPFQINEALIDLVLLKATIVQNKYLYFFRKEK